MPDGVLKPYTADKRLIPSSIADDRAIAWLQLVWGLVHFDLNRLAVYNIDTVDASVLPHLIQQFRLEGRLGHFPVQPEKVNGDSV